MPSAARRARMSAAVSGRIARRKQPRDARCRPSLPAWPSAADPPEAYRARRRAAISSSRAAIRCIWSRNHGSMPVGAAIFSRAPPRRGARGRPRTGGRQRLAQGFHVRVGGAASGAALCGPDPSSASTPISSERTAFVQRLGEGAAERHHLADRFHLRPRASDPPRGIFRTPSAGFSPPRNPAKARRPTLVWPVMSLVISSSVYPTATSAATLAIGKPVALEASAEERETRGFISITRVAPVGRIDRELHVGAAGLDAHRVASRAGPGRAAPGIRGRSGSGPAPR